MSKIVRFAVFLVMSGFVAAAVWAQADVPVGFGRQALDGALAARRLKAPVEIKVTGSGRSRKLRDHLCERRRPHRGVGPERRSLRRPRAGRANPEPRGGSPEGRRHRGAALPPRSRMEHVPDPALGLCQERYRL